MPHHDLEPVNAHPPEDELPGTPDYTLGFSDEVMEALRRYTAETSAAYLLPHLRPGQHVLDVGCGPGTISAGLAKAVHPGELHGIDMEESQVELARSVARFGGRTNASFQVADATELPFDDESFDVVHCHNVLMHIPDTASVLAEMKRVLRPGGLVGCREMICASSFNEPSYGVLRSGWDMFEDVLAADDGHPQMGKELKGHLLEAGFESIAMSTSIDVYNAPEDVAFIYEFATRWFLAPELTEAAIKYGAATQELCDRIQVAYDQWRDDPSALCEIAFGEAVASKP